MIKAVFKGCVAYFEAYEIISRLKLLIPLAEYLVVY